VKRSRLPVLATALALPAAAFLVPDALPWSAPSTAAAVEDHGSPAAVPVSVSFNRQSGRISVSADPIRIAPGEEITWSPGDGVEALAIDIPSPKAPFGQGVRANGVRGRKEGPPARVRARAGDAVKGSYKYTVAIYDGQQVYILDPDIIIN
jgi:plastocyanin